MRAGTAWGSDRLLPTSAVKPSRLDETLATLRRDERRFAANNSAAPVEAPDPAPAGNVVEALRDGLKTAAGGSLRFLRLEGNQLGPHVHEVLLPAGWSKGLDGWLSASKSPAPGDKEVWTRREAALVAGRRVDEVEVQALRHELMARLPPNLSFATP